MRDLKVHSVTFNTADNEGPPKEDLKPFLGVDSESQPDVIFIGLQEARDADKWRKEFKAVLKPYEYVLIKYRNCWAIHLFSFVKRNLLVALNNIESEVTICGAFGVMGNKGGVSIRFELCGVNIIALNAHFAAHASKKNDRLNDYLDILKTQTFRDTDVNKILDHDYVIWMGDLNFRIDLDKSDVETAIDNKKFHDLFQEDQLKKFRDTGEIFENFHEGEITFPPTYKFDIGTDIYDTSEKQRVPSWTDRILYMCHDGFIFNDANLADEKGHRIVHKQSSTATRGPPTANSTKESHDRPSIELVKYDSMAQYKYSDHRPVYADMLLKIPNCWFALPVQFCRPIEEFVSCDKDLSFSYTIMKRPVLRDTITSKSILNPETNQTIAKTPNDDIIKAMKQVDLSKAEVIDKSAMEGGNNKEEKSDKPLPPAQISADRSDWIGIYPLDFDDLKKGFKSYVYAPSESRKVVCDHTSMNESINKHILTENHLVLDNGQPGNTYSGTIDKKYLEAAAGQSVQLVYFSENKNCPQGYSKPFYIYHEGMEKLMKMPFYTDLFIKKDDRIS